MLLMLRYSRLIWISSILDMGTVMFVLEALHSIWEPSRCLRKNKRETYLNLESFRGRIDRLIKFATFGS